MLTDLRWLLAAVIVLATIGFVVGTTIERNSGESGHEPAAHRAAETNRAGGQVEGGREHGESEATHAAESSAEPAAISESHTELKPLGIDIEAAPFVAFEAIASLALAAAAWRRPRAVLLLFFIAVAMALFAVLDVREVFHQSDESRAGLAVLAGGIAVLHAAAALVAATLARRGGSRAAATIPG